jgi:hypothetical protein
MPKEIYPSSFICGCGHENRQVEKMIREMKRMSLRKRQVLTANDREHRIILEHGRFVAMFCPKENKEIQVITGCKSIR